MQFTRYSNMFLKYGIQTCTYIFILNLGNRFFKVSKQSNVIWMYYNNKNNKLCIKNTFKMFVFRKKKGAKSGNLTMLYIFDTI